MRRSRHILALIGGLLALTVAIGWFAPSASRGVLAQEPTRAPAPVISQNNDDGDAELPPVPTPPPAPVQPVITTSEPAPPTVAPPARNDDTGDGGAPPAERATADPASESRREPTPFPNAGAPEGAPFSGDGRGGASPAAGIQMSPHGHPGGGGLNPCYPAVPRPNPPRFLTLPFPDHPDMRMLHGWRYTFNNHPQCGIDYALWPDPSKFEFGRFPVLAAADGEACADTDSTGGGCVSGFGGRVLIRHEVDGETFYTYYGHLDRIDPAIPIGNRGNTVRVLRGQVVGYASNSNTMGDYDIHLHFGIASPSFGWYDPYDIYQKAAIYPDPRGVNGFLSGAASWWTTNPPVTAAASASMDEVNNPPEAALPADTLTAGIIDVSAWSGIAGREAGIVEVWINDERRAEVPFGPVAGGETSTFSWEWDTTTERNGPHRVRLVAYGEDSRDKPVFTATEAQQAVYLVTIQNPIGFIETPAIQDAATATIPITGWARADGSEIKTVEVYVNGVRRGEATYGLESRSAGGAYGFAWDWDTLQEADGRHEIVVRALAGNGGRRDLSPVTSVRETTLQVEVRNRDIVPRWHAR